MKVCPNNALHPAFFEAGIEGMWTPIFIMRIGYCEHSCVLCGQVCPTGATFKAKDGVVLIDQSYCIGCQYCVQACPYGVRYLDPRKGVADKCTWCYHRITKGLMPACVEICPTHCRVFGDVNDPEAEVTRFIRDNRVEVLKPETGNGPQVFYTGITKDVS